MLRNVRAIALRARTRELHENDGCRIGESGERVLGIKHARLRLAMRRRHSSAC